MVVRQPLAAIRAENKFDVYVTVKGGGNSGQAGAISAMALPARYLSTTKKWRWRERLWLA